MTATIHIWETNFTKLTNPATLPAGVGRGIAWSPNGEFLAIATLVINSLGDI